MVEVVGDGWKKKMEDSETRPFGGCRRLGRLLDNGSFLDTKMVGEGKVEIKMRIVEKLEYKCESLRR